MAARGLVVRATPGQEALWRAQRQGAPAAVLNLHLRLAVDGDVDAAALQGAWAALVRRHEALRTAFTVDASGALVQEVRSDVAGSLGLAVWEDDDEELRERLGRELHAWPFDLGRPPLARALLLRAGAARERHLCGHRAVLDDGCLPVLLADLDVAYRALSRGLAPAFAADPLPFRAGVEARRPAAAPPDPAGAPPVHLAARAAGGWRPEGDLDVAVLRAPLGEAAAETAGSGDCRPLPACLAAVQAVLGKGRPDATLVVGVAAPNRTERDRSIVGPLAGVAAVAARVGPTDPLRELLARAAAAVEEVPRQGPAPPGPSFGGLESREPGPPPALCDAVPRPLPRAGSGIGSGVDVQVALVASADGPVLEIEYRTDLFDREAIETLAADLERVLALMARAPDLAVGAVPIRSLTSADANAAAGRSLDGSREAEREPELEPRTRPSLVALRAAGRPHVHLFHPGGGVSASYHALVAALPEDWTVTASDDCGRGETIEDLAERYLGEVLAAHGVPDVVGGWSMGGTVAYEAIRRLRASDARLPALLLVDSAPPIGFGRGPDDATILEAFTQSLWPSLGLRRFRPAAVAGDDDDAVCALAAGLWRAGETTRPAWLLQRLDEYRRHLRAAVRYVCADRVDVPAVLLAAVIQESHVDEWRRRLRPDTPVLRLAAGHFDVMREPLVAEVARQLELLVARLTGSGPSGAR